MKRYASLISLILACSISVYAQNPVQQYVEQLCGTEELKEAVWGIKAVKASGTVIAEHNASTRMLPASNTKLITTGIALSELGKDFRFTTTLSYSGELRDSVLVGDLYIVGGGDPTIGARDSISTPLQSTFAQWEKILRSAGIKRIEGRVVGDGRFFDGEREHLSWQIEDIGYDYAPGGTGLCFYENMQDFTVTPGKAVGDRVSVKVAYPETPWITLRSVAVTGKAGSGNGIYYLPTDLAPVGEMRGSLAVDRRSIRFNGSNKFGAMTCAYYFYKYLEGRGIAVTDGPADIDRTGALRDFSDEELPAAVAQAKLTSLGSTQSPVLKDIIRKTNHDSDNFYAETLLRILAKEKTGSASYDSCKVAENAALRRLGMNIDVQIVDGSGLSRDDYVTPDFFIRFLDAMRKSPVYNDYLGTLPQPGKGTLETRMLMAPATDKSRIYMKSGSMGGVRCFSGYILPASGKAEDTIIFSIMTNNTTVSSSRINFIMDKLIGLLAQQN